MQLAAEDYLPLLKLLPLLENLSQVRCGAAVQELAFGLRSVIATRGAVRPEDLRPHPGFSFTGKQRTAAQGPPQCGGAAGAALNKAECSSEPPQSRLRGFSEVLLEASEPDVPSRAVALRELTRMVQERSPEALQAQEEILDVSEALLCVALFPSEV